MGIVANFEHELFQKSPKTFGNWHAIDLHNHSPHSFDYQPRGDDFLDRTARQVLETDLSVVMFTDHIQLPSDSFINELHDKTGKLILKGVELNVFVDAWSKPRSKIEKNLFFHLLVGFDPTSDKKPEFWLDYLYHECKNEVRQSGGTDIKGITDSIQKICEKLKDSNAIVIPAHLHSDNNAFKSRSIDDIYCDLEFLRAAKECFTALEVTDVSTAKFFDGKHSETNNLEKACIRSSDAHWPEALGTRPCFAQMENVTFAELKNALELPFRVSLDRPTEPRSFVIGLNIQGQYFPDLWLSLSPNCNVFMGVKGSGKTSVLECLRFVLGVEVPQSRNDDVHSHLTAILGAGGTVKALVKRTDGAKILIQRTINSNQFNVTFNDDRKQVFTHSEAIQFTASILGWHEIEQAATDPKIRRVYLDAISGRETIRQYEEELKVSSRQIHDTHDSVFNKFKAFRDVQVQLSRLQQRREGLQKLTDAKLISLKKDYEAAIRHRELLNTSLNELKSAKSQIANRFSSLLPGINENQLDCSSPVEQQILVAKDSLKSLFQSIDIRKKDFEAQVTSTIQVLQHSSDDVEKAFNDFSEQYRQAISQLTSEQQQLLESHQRVMEETKQLPALESQLNNLRVEIEQLINQIIQQCNSAANKIEQRCELRRKKVAEFSEGLEEFSIKLEVSAYTQIPFQTLVSSHPEGWAAFNELPQSGPDLLLYRRMKEGYENLLLNLTNDSESHYPSFLRSGQFGFFIDISEEEDLIITFRPTGQSGISKPIDQLSAGQRCTAFFPILLKLQEGPLIVDQPEDNLDNRYIASSIAPVLLNDKHERQIILTSHNANLVVLSDAEHIVSFEGQGDQGVILARGFLSGQLSLITPHVLDVLDGGSQALNLRRMKYGSPDPNVS